MPTDEGGESDQPQPGPALESPRGRVLVLGTRDVAAASRLEALLQARGIGALLLWSPEFCFGGWNLPHTGGYQVWVWEEEADARAEEVQAALAEVRAEWAEPVPDAETEAEPATE